MRRRCPLGKEAASQQRWIPGLEGSWQQPAGEIQGVKRWVREMRDRRLMGGTDHGGGGGRQRRTETRRGTETHSERGYRLPARGGYRNSGKGALDRDRSIKIQKRGEEGEGDIEIKINQLRQKQNCRARQPETQALQSMGPRAWGEGPHPGGCARRW